MKIVKFQSNLVPLIISGQKTSTWRLFDDKELSVDDDIALQEFGRDVPFANAKIVEVIEKPLGKLTEADKEGHEPYSSDYEMYDTFSGYYKTNVGPETLVKIIRFKLLK